MKSIGQIIQDEVRRQNIEITAFAKSINKSRTNAYNIFSRNDIDIVLLRKISEVLHHNYFKDLADDASLACPVDDEVDLTRMKALDNFWQYVPKAFDRLDLFAPVYCFPKNGLSEDCIVPDFFLPNYNISFTMGGTFEEKNQGKFDNNLLSFQPISGDAPAKMVGYMMMEDGLQFLDIAVDVKTEAEWFDTICFALDTIKILYLPRTKEYLKELNSDVK